MSARRRASRGLRASLLAIALLGTGCAQLPSLSSPEPATELYDRSLRAYASKDYRLAALLLEKVVERVPSDAEAWFRLGNAYSRTDRPRDAVRAYQQAVLKKNDHERAWYNLGIVQTRIAANSFLEMSASLDPEDPMKALALDMAEALLAALAEHSRPKPQKIDSVRPTGPEAYPDATIVERPRPSTEAPSAEIPESATSAAESPSSETSAAKSSAAETPETMTPSLPTTAEEAASSGLSADAELEPGEDAADEEAAP
ncbi:MAG: tetratricopeptide repeat protein [Myxococcota bacterium]